LAVKNNIGCEHHTLDLTLQKPFVGGSYANFHPLGVEKEGHQVYLRKPNGTFDTQSVESIVISSDVGAARLISSRRTAKDASLKQCHLVSC
jgi:hypothetical protein